MKKIIICSIVTMFMVCGIARADLHVTFDFETSWTGDYADGWENTAYRHGDPPVGQMMQQTTLAHSGSYGMMLIADSVPEDWMWWAAVNPIDVSSDAMLKQYDPWVSVWYYDEQLDNVAGQMFAVPSWVNMYIDGSEDWTDVQFGGRFNVTDDYYYVAAGESNPGWEDTGEARSTGWHQLKMQLSSTDGRIHFYLDGTEVGTSWRDDYIDLGSEIGLYTMFLDPLSAWGEDKPYTIWDDFEFGSTVPLPGAVLLGILGLGAVGIKLRKYA